jgi:hypothetical protein
MVLVRCGRTMLVLGLAALLLGAAGCGGSNSTSTPTGTTSQGSTATSTRAPRPAADWVTYHRNLARTGVDPTSLSLGQVRQKWTRQLDGQVYAEPLVAGGRVFVAS